MTKAKLNSDFHGVPAGTELVVVSDFIDWQGNKVLVVERADGLDLPTMGGPYVRTNVAAEFVTIDEPTVKLTRNQYDALCTLDRRVGSEAHVFTSQYIHNVNPEFSKIACGYVKNATLRGLEKRGFIRIVETYWKGCTVEVLKGLPENVELTDR